MVCKNAWSWGAPWLRMRIIIARRAYGRYEPRRKRGYEAALFIDVNEEFGTTIVLIEHDMGVVMDLS